VQQKLSKTRSYGQPASSRQDSATKSAILDFVARVTKEGGPGRYLGHAGGKYDLMHHEMLTKRPAKENEVIYWGRPLDRHNQTLTVLPDIERVN
jgi:hypothetical protein